MQAKTQTHHVIFRPSDSVCLICLNPFINPVIASDGEVYCEDCIREWVSVNDTSPVNIGDNISDNAMPVPLTFRECEELTKVYQSINGPRYRFDDLYNMCSCDCNDITLNEPSDIKLSDRDLVDILNVIDRENYYRLKGPDRVKNAEKFYKIFSNHTLIQRLIDSVDLKWIGCDKWKLIHYVCRFGTVQLLKYMGEKGVDLEAPEKDKWCPIHFVCARYLEPGSNGTLEGIKYLISCGVDLEGQNDAFKPIHVLCSIVNGAIPLKSSDLFEAIRLLVNGGVNLESETDKGWRPIHYVCSEFTDLNSKDRLEAIKLLIDRKVNLDSLIKGGLSPMYLLCGNKMISYYKLQAIVLMSQRIKTFDIRCIQQYLYNCKDDASHSRILILRVLIQNIKIIKSMTYEKITEDFMSCMIVARGIAQTDIHIIQDAIHIFIVTMLGITGIDKISNIFSIICKTLDEPGNGMLLRHVNGQKVKTSADFWELLKQPTY